MGSNLDVIVQGKGTVTIPTSQEISGISGLQIPLGNYLLNYTLNLNPLDDYVQGWTYVLGVPLGLRVWLFGNRIELIGGYNLYPSGSGMLTAQSASDSEAYTIADDTEWVLWVTEWETASSSAQLTLTTPTGQPLTEAEIEQDPTMALVPELSTEHRRAVRLLAPAAGSWEISISSNSDLGALDFLALVNDPLPTIDVVDTSDGLFRQPVEIELAAYDSDSQASVAVFYDTDATGFDGVMITDGLVETDGTLHYTWDTTGVVAGQYHIYARITDQHNPPVFAYAPESTHISDYELVAVILEQAAGQADPAFAPTIHFTVAFGEPVHDFTDSDISLSGTAGATTVTVTNPSGDNRQYVVSISGMSHDGTVIATIPAGVAHDGDGNPNAASTDIDNMVTYQLRPWHNPDRPVDVNGDTLASPLDALLVVNYLNANGGGPVPGSPAAAPPFYDVNADNQISPLDALLVVNHLNSVGAGGAEAASSYEAGAALPFGQPLEMMSDELTGTSNDGYQLLPYVASQSTSSGSVLLTGSSRREALQEALLWGPHDKKWMNEDLEEVLAELAEELGNEWFETEAFWDCVLHVG